MTQNYCVFAGNATGSHLPESVSDGEEGVREGGADEEVRGSSDPQPCPWGMKPLDAPHERERRQVPILLPPEGPSQSA